MKTEPHWELLKVVSAVFESEMIVALLKGADIPSMVKGPEVGIWGGGWSGPVAQGISIYVPSDRHHEATQLLESAEGPQAEQ
jgi:hypothetical protein